MDCALKILMLCAAIVAGGETAHAAIVVHKFATDNQIRYLVVEGEFELSDQPELLVNEALQHEATFVIFHSPGGNLESAMRWGRTIRILGLNTFQIKALECSSACALAFLGGVKRYAEPGSIGVHKSSFSDTTGMDIDDAISTTQAVTARLIGYLKEMDVDPGFLQLSLEYESWDIRYLSLSEMVQFNVINLEEDGYAPSVTAAPPRDSSDITVRRLDDSFAIPRVRSGRVRHPSGSIALTATPDAKGIAIARIPNRTPVQVLGDSDRWYRVAVDGRTGYAHHTWIKVDQFHPSAFDKKFVQIKSFDNHTDAARFVRTSPLRLAAFLATNGWFAVTLDGQYPDNYAADLLKKLKSEGRIPNDSFRTYGNTYVRKVCCD